MNAGSSEYGKKPIVFLLESITNSLVIEVLCFGG